MLHDSVMKMSKIDIFEAEAKRRIIHQFAMNRQAAKDDDPEDAYIVNSYAEEFDLSYSDAKKKVFMPENMGYVFKVSSEYDEIMKEAGDD